MKGAWLALLWAGNAVVDGATADQRIEISRAIDFFAVEIEVGRNTVAELFPTAPLGTVIFMLSEQWK